MPASAQPDIHEFDMSMPEETRRTTQRLDPRSPLVLDTRELGRRPGTMRRLSRTVRAPSNLGVQVLGVPPGSALELDLRLESVVEGVLVSATVAATVSGECVRCLDPVEQALLVDLQELYAYQDADQADLPRLEGDLIDLEPALRDAVVLALPLRPRCREDCQGLCVQCGARLDDGTDGTDGTDDTDDTVHQHDEVDPRWAALSQLND